MTSIAVIGCGAWGPNHIRVFTELPGARVAAAVDVAEEPLARVRQLNPDVRCERDYRSVLADEEIDAVVVATPTLAHHELVREALLAGKHVLCEKPLCARPVDADELVRLAEEMGRVLMVGHVFLFNGGIVKVKELIDAGELGAILYLSASRTNLGPIRRDVNAAFDLASHDIAIFNWLLDAQPQLVSAFGGAFLQPGIEDVTFVSMRYPGGVVASMRSSWLDPKKVRQLTVVGTRRMLTWDDLEISTPIAVYDKGASANGKYSDFDEFLHLSMWDGDVRLPKIQLGESLKLQASMFLEYLASGRVERSDGAFGAGVVRVLDAIQQSLQADGAPVEAMNAPLSCGRP